MAVVGEGKAFQTSVLLFDGSRSLNSGYWVDDMRFMQEFSWLTVTRCCPKRAVVL